jgi:opacity protein-like surface antigen
MMRKSCLTIFVNLLSGLMVCYQAHASVMTPVGPQFSIYAGATYSNSVPGSSTLISTNNIGYEIDTHVGNDNNTAFTPGFGIAYDFLTTSQITPFIHDVSVGVDWFYFNSNLTGTVNLYNDASLNYYDYTLHYTSTWLMLGGQINFQPIAKITPFVLAGLDLARIANSYSTLRNSQAPDYLNVNGLALPTGVNYNAAYSLGAGVKLPIRKNVLLSARYLFTDLGNIVTGGNTLLANGTFADTIQTRLYVQAWLIGLSYAI